MISAEKLLDSLGNLPDDLILETQALRSRKPVHWVKWTALAACACLCIGLWFAFPGATKSDNAAGTPPMEGVENALGDIETDQSTVGFMDAIVYSVGDDHITVTSATAQEFLDGKDGYCIQQVQRAVLFDNLEEIPHFEPGQKIRIYCDETDSSGSLLPYRVEILEDEEVQQ